ncbi:MAG: amidohydrolase family protein, partial [Eubacteriales bacterium]
KLDVVSYVMMADDTDEIMTENKDFVKQYVNGFKIGGYKVVLDGSPQGKSAWLTKPYENSDGYCAYSWLKDEVVESMMKKAVADNMQVLVHCNGDASGDQFLSALTKAIDESDNPNKRELRPVMIHCQTAREDQLDIMKEYQLIPSIFVGHVYYWGDVHLKNLGKERASNISPVASAYNRGLVVNFHQDTPVTKPKMLHTVWAAVNRVTRGGIVLGAHQTCSVYEALKAVTINAAYAYFEEDSKGSIVVGKRADLVILDKNPMEVPKMEIKDITVLETIKDGVSVYKNN